MNRVGECAIRRDPLVFRHGNLPRRRGPELPGYRDDRFRSSARLVPAIGLATRGSTDSETPRYRNATKDVLCQA
jgi:hypothetical protein